MSLSLWAISAAQMGMVGALKVIMLALIIAITSIRECGSRSSSASSTSSISLTESIGCPQVYAVPTYNTPFRLLMSNDTARQSFFEAFLPGDMKVVSSERLDGEMNPLQKFQKLRRVVNDKDNQNVARALRRCPTLQLRTGHNLLEDKGSVKKKSN
jgi:hypothetical protein